MTHNRLKQFCRAEKISFAENFSLKKFNTFKVESSASLFLRPQVMQLPELMKFLFAEEIDFLVLGGGSNLLLGESIDKPVVYWHNMGKNNFSLTMDAHHALVEADASASSFQLAKFACDNSLRGAEFLYTIPGSLGGAITQNAGCYGGEVKDIIFSARVFTPQGEKFLNHEQMQLAYRSSIFKKEEWFIFSLVFRLQKDEQKLCAENMRKFKRQRLETQPKGKTAGSVFKNPTNDSRRAWQIIDACGLKEKNINGAFFSSQHANFIINHGSASGSDINRLIQLAQKTVLEKTGVELELEIVRWGSFKTS